MRLPPRLAAFVISTLISLAPLGFSQTSSPGYSAFTRIYGPEDTDVVIPAAVFPLGRQDAGGLQVVLDFLKASGTATWSGMQATGTLMEADGQTTYPATLTVQGGDRFRLDVSAPDGARSMRILGNNGRIMESDGYRHILPLATAANGLLAFPKVLVSTFPNTKTSVLDQGMIVIGGQSLHRITIEAPLDGTTTPSTIDQISLMDLYFDPTSALLLKSVGWVQINSADRERYVQAVTYGDYQTVDGLVLPSTISQRLNGQPQWSIRMTSITFPVVDDSYFQF